jgi:hypothetical protein
MKRLLFTALAAALMSTGTGCCCFRACDNCGDPTFREFCLSCAPARFPRHRHKIDHGWGHKHQGEELLGDACCKCNCPKDCGYTKPEDFVDAEPAPDYLSGAHVVYPYYTTRGPRDFFLDQPPSIGP